MPDYTDEQRRSIAVAWARVAIAGNRRLGREPPQWMLELVADWEREHPLPV
jgi:hypothetical protein